MTLADLGPAGSTTRRRVRVLGPIRLLDCPLRSPLNGNPSASVPLRIVSVLVEGETEPRPIAAERLVRDDG